MSPVEAKEAGKRTSWHASVIGTPEPLLITMFSAVPLIGIASSQTNARAAGILAALTVLAELVPLAAHQLNSRLNLDRPVTTTVD